MSFINLMGYDIWSEADIANRQRSVIASQVSEVRQNELRTIMLGHIAQMRVATPSELAEIKIVKDITEEAAKLWIQSRADMVLLQAALDYEEAEKVISSAEDPADPKLLPFQAVLDNASTEVKDLVLLRKPVVIESEVEVPVVEELELTQ